MTPIVVGDEPSTLSLSAYGPARSTVQGTPLSPTDLQKIDAYWRACKYLALPMNKSMPAPEEQRVHSRTLWLGDAGGFPCACGGAALLGQRCSRRTALPCAADETECEPACGRWR